MRKIRVIFIIESFILGGAERVLVNIANHLDSNLFDVTICSIYKKSVYNDYQATFDKPFKPHVHFKWLVNNKFQLLYLIFNYIFSKFPSIIYKFLIGDKYDVVIAFYEGAPTTFIGKSNIKKGRKIAWLHTTTDLSQKNRSSHVLKQIEECYNNFSKIVAVSNGVRDSFIKLFPSQSEKVEVIYNPMDMMSVINKSKESISLKKPSSPLLLSVGRMTRAKGYDRYLKILKKLKDEGFHFEVWIIGGGDTSQHKRYCKEVHLNNVTFLGNQKNPYPFMLMADWIVIPSIIEGLSTVALESLILHKAVFMSDCNGAKEILGNSQYGYVADNDEESIYHGLKSILSNPSIKKEFESSCSKAVQYMEQYNSIHNIQTIFM